MTPKVPTRMTLAKNHQVKTPTSILCKRLASDLRFDERLFSEEKIDASGEVT